MSSYLSAAQGKDFFGNCAFISVDIQEQGWNPAKAVHITPKQLLKIWSRMGIIWRDVNAGIDFFITLQCQTHCE